MNKTISWIIVLIIVAAGIGIGYLSLSRPEVKKADEAAVLFSADRALEHVKAISIAPHPPGSDEIGLVREYILAELKALGLSPEVQESNVVYPQGSRVLASSIKNIYVRIPGLDSSQTILLDAHYDTRAMTPGASDCGSCVATLLETTRAILAGPSLRNDLILLFTDNEEYGGGLGAAAFLENYPDVEDIGLVLNFEGLGSTGPSILFETGPDTGWAVKDWGQVASYPVGQSWFYEIYRLTPIGTDLNHFSDAGISGMNFGYWAQGTVYHSKLDNPETIDVRSLQHHGDYAIDMIKHFGNLDLAEKRSAGSSVYFTIFPGFLVNYPASWALPLSLAGSLLLFILVLIGKKRELVTIKGLLKGTGVYFLSLLLSAGLATGIWMGLTQLHGEYQAILTFRGVGYNARYYLMAFIALSMSIAAGIQVLYRKKNSLLDFQLGTLVLFAIIALATSILMPGFSYLFTWPLFFSSLAAAWSFRTRTGSKSSPNNMIVAALGILPTIVLYVSALYVMYHFALAPMIGILAFMAALILGTFIPLFDQLTQSQPWRLSIISLVICLVFLVIGSLTAGFTPDQPQPNAVAYLLNGDSGDAYWFSGGSLQDDWTEQFFTDAPVNGAVRDLYPLEAGSGFPIMYGTAPSLDIDPPTIEVVSDQRTSSLRRVVLDIQPKRGGQLMQFDLSPYQALSAVTLDGKQFDVPESTENFWSLTYYAVPEEGFTLTLELDPEVPIQLQVSEQSWLLSEEVLSLLESPYQPRSDNMMPMPNFDYGTVVVKTIDLE